MVVKLKTLKNIQLVMDAEDIIELKEVMRSWIIYLKSQENIFPNNESFDFDNQLDDFIELNGSYNNVIQFIKWFFNLRK